MAKSKNNKYRGKTIRKRGSSWQVDYGIQCGKRVQRTYKTKSDAEQAVDDFCEQQRTDKIDTRNKKVALHHLTDKQRMDVITAMDLLPSHRTLTEAVEFYKEHTCPSGGSKAVKEVLEDYLAAKQKANLRAASIKEIKYRMGNFAKDFGKAEVHTISHFDLEKWIDKKGFKKVSMNKQRIMFLGFFKFAQKHGYINHNPAEKLDKAMVDQKTTEIFTAKQAQKLMYAAEATCPEMVPYFAICLFAGLRPSETQHLDWKHINLQSKLITVRPETAKQRRQRHVDISSNLLAWLAPYRRDSGNIGYSRNAFEFTRRKAKVGWHHDVLRHSFGSYHLAHHEDAAKTALQMGHIRTDILFVHYRDLVTREQASEFWSIEPKRESNVIEMSA